MRCLNNTNIAEAKASTSDLEVYGKGDLWVCLCKASSQRDGWMKSTKVMEIFGVGCVVQVTTQLSDYGRNPSAAEAVTFVPGVKIASNRRELVPL